MNVWEFKADNRNKISEQKVICKIYKIKNKGKN